MFGKHQDVPLLDLSTDLRDEQDWKPGPLRTFDFPLDVSALAVDPVSGMLAAGTASGVIYLFGGPGVESKITLPEPLPVRFLHFSLSTSSILCLDEHNSLHAWNLLQYGRPKLTVTARFDQVNSITLSPSHSHVFLATHKGEIKTYDLVCRRKSPYIMPDMWKLYEAEMKADGVPSLVPSIPSTGVDSIVHPRNLNLLFVAYSNGIVLTDLTSRNTVRVYELILPPGAPGGAGYAVPDILTHRRLSVTCLAIHPTGHFFAVGYADGAIAIWATEDDTKPLLVRTLDEDDVIKVDSHILESYLDGKNTASQSLREPIFKLVWSGYTNSADPRGGETTLAVLGGLDATEPPGFTVLLLPPFNPTDPPPDQPAAANTLHPHFRTAMQKSLIPSNTFYYETPGIVQDFLMKPKESPHFAGNFEPEAILVVVEGHDTSRTVVAYQFPPPGFLTAAAQVPSPPEEAEEIEETVDEVPLRSPPPPPLLAKSPRHLVRPPSSLFIPLSLSPGVVGGEIIRLDNEIYADFVDASPAGELSLLLKAGKAYPDESHLNELKLSKYQPHRILIIPYRDLSIRFYDISAQLLIPKSPSLDCDFPSPLANLTVKLGALLDDTTFCKALSIRPEDTSIKSVHTASEALECAIVLHSGEVVVYHSSPHAALHPDAPLILLTHLPAKATRLTPYFMLAPQRGPVESCAISDTGFLAVSYHDGSLIIVDMRGPRIIFFQGTSKKAKHGSLINTHRSSLSSDVIKALTWTISPLEKDPSLSVRLIAMRDSGAGEVYTLTHSGRPVTWQSSVDPVQFKATPHPLANGLFVMDSRTGAQWKADRTRLAASYNGVQISENRSGHGSCLFISVGIKGARCSLDITGERVAKVDWNQKAGLAQSAQVVEHMGSHALVVQTDKHDALVYSLPHLEHIQTMQIPTTSPLPISIEGSGDFIAWNPHPKYRAMQSASYGTLFNTRRAYTLPDIDFSTMRGTIPPQPQPVSLGPPSYLGSWFSFNQTISGAQVDELLGGPDRPIPEPPAYRSGDGNAGGVGEGAAGFAASAAAVQANLYNRLTSAMGERGQMLGDLEERFNSLEEGSRSMVAQAKRLATEQTAKSWFAFR